MEGTTVGVVLDRVGVVILASLAAGLLLLAAGLGALLIAQIARARRERADLEAALAAAEASRPAVEARGEAPEKARGDGETAVRERLARAVARAEAPDGPWLQYADASSRTAPLPPGESIPVLAFAGLKGGVARTTLAANLAAWFDARGERVLVIDLDPRGDLGTTLLGRASGNGADRAAALLEGRWPTPRAIPGFQSTGEMIAAGPDLERVAARETLLATLGESPDDPRRRLADLLLGPRIQTVYDRVILDTPADLGLASLGALCAATHLLVPTHLTDLSAAAVEGFLARRAGLHPAPLPPGQDLRVIGVQRTWARGGETRSERRARGRIEAALAAHGFGAGHYMAEATVAQMSGFARAAGQGVALWLEPSVRPEIERLGQAVAALAPSWAEEPEEP